MTHRMPHRTIRALTAAALTSVLTLAACASDPRKDFADEATLSRALEGRNVV